MWEPALQDRLIQREIGEREFVMLIRDVKSHVNISVLGHSMGYL
jgi:hypothetical protein